MDIVGNAQPGRLQTSMQDEHAKTNCAIVVGGGPSGLIAALALASGGVNVTLVAPRRRPDPRTTALMDGSVRALTALGVWHRLSSSASPLRTMRLIDGTKRLIRAPEVSFRANEMDLDAFAWNLENEAMNTALDEAVSAAAITRIEAQLIDFTQSEDSVQVRLDSGEVLNASLLVAVDGRDSTIRRLLDIPMATRSYPQVAVTATVTHERPHNDISTEFHTETGPFTIVPLPGNRSSIVCVVSPSDAEALLALDAEAFGLAVERRAHSILGRMRLESSRGSFPLSARTAERFAAGRVVLMGEAAHVIPPIGAQGLNLGIRDAATLAELAADALRDGGDIGNAELTKVYEQRRRADVGSRTLAVDLFNRSLLSELAPIHGLRGLGLWLLDRLPPLRHAMMREGLGPTHDIPRLLAGTPL